MPKCDVCGNDYDKTFTVELAGRSMTFDCFECAIFAMAPECVHCGCRVIGHGIEGDGQIYCCAHCARQSGVGGISGRVEAPALHNPFPAKLEGRNRSWQPGDKGPAREGLSSGYGGSDGPGTGPSGPEDEK